MRGKVVPLLPPQRTEVGPGFPKWLLVVVGLCSALAFGVIAYGVVSVILR